MHIYSSHYSQPEELAFAPNLWTSHVEIDLLRLQTAKLIL